MTMTVNYSMSFLKSILVNCVSDAYLAIGNANANTEVEYKKELVCKAMFKVLKENTDTDTHEQTLELLEMIFMLQGITHNCLERAREEGKMDYFDEYGCEFPF
mgnify:FL=1